MISLMIKPVSSSCNQKCSYCFYRDEEKHRKDRSVKVMSEDTVHHIVENISGDVSIVFQGGEPTLAGFEFFEQFVEETEKKAARTLWSIQTNGSLLDEKWCHFFNYYGFLVGLSMDGPKEVHDKTRDGSYEKTLRALHLLQKYEVEYSVLCVVNSANVHHAKEVYEFFKEQNVNSLQFIPCLNLLDGKEEISSCDYGRFLLGLFELWKEDIDKGKNISIRYFENILRILLGMDPESCGFGKCYPQYVIEANGDLYPCDFYCLDEYKIGNIVEGIKDRNKERQFFQDFIHSGCRRCKWYRFCRGGCKRDYVDSRNRLCASYQLFFKYAYKDLLEIRDRLKSE